MSDTQDHADAFAKKILGGGSYYNVALPDDPPVVLVAAPKSNITYM